MPTIKFFTLGCKANQYDTQSIRERFLEKGFSDSGKSKADYFLVNTCTVTSGADQKSRNAIRKCNRLNPVAKIIVTGCLVEKDHQSLAGIGGISLLVKKSFFPEGITRFSGHTRAFLKIQDGCGNFCTYCKVALVRGRERSKDIKQVIYEARKLIACGHKEIVLTGICLGAYGKDLKPKRDLSEVIDELEKIEGLLRIRLSSIEAGDISSRLMKRFRKNAKLCRHLHVPIQSGDNHVLKLMNRKYTAKKYLNLVKRLKSVIPGLSITTDCMIGFPGEEEVNFKNTLNLIKKIMPLKVHIFPYSNRPGTKASRFASQTDPSAIRSRCRTMEDAAEISRLSFMRKSIGKKVSVLIEGRSKDNPDFLEGLTDNYLQVKLPFKPGLKNKIIFARLRSIGNDSYAGEYID